MENKFNLNLRERNPQTAIVEAINGKVSDIKVGDKILVHHFTFTDGNGERITPIHKKDGVEYYNVAYDECFFVLDDNGEILKPIGNYVLCEAIEEILPEVLNNGIAIPELARKQQKRDDRKLVVLHPGNSEEVDVGDIIIAQYHYEVTINKKKYIRIREENILVKVL